MAETQKKIRKYKPRKFLGPEAEETIKEDIRQNNLTMAAACKKYEIAVSTYYRLRELSKNGPVKES